MPVKKLITHPITGETFSITSWCTKLGLSRKSLKKRIEKHPLEIALSPYYLTGNESKTILEIKHELKQSETERWNANKSGKTLVNVCCPKCDALEMIVVTNRRDNSKFLGCYKYPECDGTRNIDKVNTNNFVNIECPKCNHPIMAERVSKSKSFTFLGCVKFPKCDGYRAYTDKVKEIIDNNNKSYDNLNHWS